MATACCLVFLTPELHAQAIAITGATVLPASGPRLENATVLIEDGRIAAVGTDVPIPTGAHRIDATGRWVTPGLINAATQLGLVEISSVPGNREGSDGSAAVSAAFNVLEGINPASQIIPVTRTAGVTTVVSAPSGGLIAGQAIAIDLLGPTIEDMVIASPVAMIAAINEGAKETGGGSRAGVMTRLRQLFEDARELDRRRNDFRRDQMQELSAPAADLEALLPVLRGVVPLVIRANRRSDIENALRLKADYDLDIVLAGAEEGWQVAASIVTAGVPVIVDPLANIPSYNAPSARLDNAALLSAAGANVIVMGNGFQSSHNARNIRQAAGHAVAYGMEWAAALRSVTINPARALGIDDRYGSLDIGKVANVVIWTGDPFELSTGVEAVFIRGQPVPLTSRQHELLERYRTLPPSY